MIKLTLTISLPIDTNYINLYKTKDDIKDHTKDNIIDIRHIKILKKISKGASGQIYEVKYKNKIMAMKTVTPRKSTKIKNTHLNKEIKLLSTLNHPNIIKYKGRSITENVSALLMEYCKHGSVARILKNKGSLPEDIIRSVCYQTLTGLQYIHDTKNIIHRDIKCGNVVISDEGVCKIIDFELAKKSNDKIKKCQGTWSHMSPEALKNNAVCDQKTDIWSLGIMCINMSKYNACKTTNICEIINNVLNCPSPKLSNEHKFSNEFRNFVDLTLLKDPVKRPSSKTLLKHKWFINDDNYEAI